MEISLKTDIGLVRSLNQDVCYGEVEEDATWAVVCDGMGGENCGEVASKICCDKIAEQMKNGYRTDMKDLSIKNLMTLSFYNANLAIYQHAQQNIECRGMGTTAVLALLKDNVLHICNVGDSRALLIKNNSVERLTKDHSFAQAMADLGEIEQDKVDSHPQKNMLVRAMGIEQDVNIDYFVYDIQSDDILLLCSDGLTNMVSEENIAKICNENKSDTEKMAEQLIIFAKNAGGLDNITVAIIKE